MSAETKGHTCVQALNTLDDMISHTSWHTPVHTNTSNDTTIIVVHRVPPTQLHQDTFIQHTTGHSHVVTGLPMLPTPAFTVTHFWGSLLTQPPTVPCITLTTHHDTHMWPASLGGAAGSSRSLHLLRSLYGMETQGQADHSPRRETGTKSMAPSSPTSPAPTYMSLGSSPGPWRFLLTYS